MIASAALAAGPPPYTTNPGCFIGPESLLTVVHVPVMP
jgi:hypothetical protein